MRIHTHTEKDDNDEYAYEGGKSVSDRVISHDYELKRIKEILTSVASNQKETSVQVNLLANSISKLDLYLEKQNAIEAKYVESVNRLHKRLDANDAAIKEFTDTAVERGIMKKDIELLDKRVVVLESYGSKVVWGILTAVGMAILGLVIN